MTALETSISSENDKHNKRHKHTLDEALQAVLEFNDGSDYSDLSDEGSAWSIIPTTVTNYNLFLLLTTETAWWYRCE